LPQQLHLIPQCLSTHAPSSLFTHPTSCVFISPLFYFCNHEFISHTYSRRVIDVIVLCYSLVF
ncbi:hypothetical protein O181_077455, partial [Austropuccinia psidii MF-1]|nr:hypothetical protein [Austropuccinia psidii MF-1]